MDDLLAWLESLPPAEPVVGPFPDRLQGGVEGRVESGQRTRLSLSPLDELGGRYPLVTVTYAQSIDGSLTRARGLPTALSGPETRQMTHRLRAWHDGILVGIGTLLADDPHLSVRHASGPNPRPVVLDTHLRIPDGCRLLARTENLPWLAACAPVDPHRQAELEARGARVLALPPGADGRVDLSALLEELYRLGLRRLMVEGGAGVISAFLRQRLADVLIVTVAPLLLGGLNAIESTLVAGGRAAPALRETHIQQMGSDVVIWGELTERAI